MIYVTGHLKDGINTLKNLKTEDNKTLGEGDKLIVCGDCLYFYMMPLFTNNNPYDKELDAFESGFKGEVFLVPGVNDKIDMLDNYPTITAYGGSMKKIRENFFALENGGLYNFDNNSFFVMGGGYKPGISFGSIVLRSPQNTIPPNEVLFRILQVFEEHGMKTDYIITHTAPYTFALVFDDMISPEESQLMSILDCIFDKADYTHWYFGRYGKDKSTIHSKVTACWNGLYLIE